MFIHFDVVKMNKHIFD